MKIKTSVILFACILCVYAMNAFSQSDARLLRFPAIHDNQIVFSYAGDLYTVPATGGTARKITNNIGYEMFPRFSPDGKYIAFTGQYDGNTEVYLIPAEGGVPKRLTYTATLGRDDVSDRMGPNNIVMCWKDNETIVYRSRQHEFNDFKGQLYTVSINGGISEQLPLPRGGFCSFNADGSKMVYNRVFREFRTWKHYRGGQADEVWLYDFKTKKTENLTNNPAQDIMPMWSGNIVYFLSDRDYRMNLFSYNLDTKETKKLTNFTEFDCKFASLGNNAIVFENGGYIYRFDLQTQQAAKVPIALNEDFNIGRNTLVDVSRGIHSFEVAPDGKRALFSARGDIFTVPVKNGPTRNLTATSNVHERNPKWSPDGKWIAYIADATGEDEIYIQAPDGNSAPVQITKGSSNYKYALYWSPDSKKILWSDRQQRLNYVDIDEKKVVQVDKSDIGEIGDYTWSPDSKWIAYTKEANENINRIYAYSLESEKIAPVTDEWYSSGEPEFSADGKYLYFVSNRSFNPIYGWLEWNHVYRDMAKPYLVTLNKDIHSPFEPKSDETAAQDTAAKKEKKDEAKSDKSVALQVDFDHIYDRVLEIPVQAAYYYHLTSVGTKLYYQRRGSADHGSQVCVFDLGEKKETELGEVGGYEISADKKKMLVVQNQAYGIIDIPSGKIELKDKLSLSDMKVFVDHHAEWKQIFDEAWRQMRDFFFAPNMHGLDWQKVHDTYAQLVPYVNHRADLTYIIGEMIGELCIGHAYVGGGEYPKAERIKLGLLGALITRDADSKYYQITKILKGANWDASLRSPLTEIGVNVSEGDYIIAVNGKSTKDMNDIFAAFVNTADKQVTLTVNSSPKEKGARTITVVPTDDEQELYYYNWVQNNIEKVNKATNGQVGYIHVPDMGPAGLNQFSKLYYPQLQKKALIIDVRGNGGGNVSPMLMERLQRQMVMIDIERNGAPHPDPSGTHVGPKVALIDEFSASDGDIFSYRFKQSKLGPTIGKRTWGGVVGIRGSLPFIDGGFLNRPEFSRYDVNGKEWIMEGHGVDPDIVVDNDPALEFEGTDQQLNTAIDEVMKALKNWPEGLATPPPYPDKSK